MKLKQLKIAAAIFVANYAISISASAVEVGEVFEFNVLLNKQIPPLSFLMIKFAI